MCVVDPTKTYRILHAALDQDQEHPTHVKQWKIEMNDTQSQDSVSDIIADRHGMPRRSRFKLCQVDRLRSKCVRPEESPCPPKRG
jgi:hypothetical protein